MNTTLEPKLPVWFNKWDQSPIASAKGWLKLKVDSKDRECLLQAQKEFDEIMAQMPKGHPVDIGRHRWTFLRGEYSRTRDERLLDELDSVGDRGRLLAEELRVRKRAVRQAAKAVPITRNLAPIYHRTFQAAVAIVLERVRSSEQSERESAEFLDMPFVPSPTIKGLCHLATWLTNEANRYRDWTTDRDYLGAPRDVLGELWEPITKGNK